MPEVDSYSKVDNGSSRMMVADFVDGSGGELLKEIAGSDSTIREMPRLRLLRKS